MNEILQENERLKKELDKLLENNMELEGVIRTLRSNLRKDNEQLDKIKRTLRILSADEH